ncbi:MAG: succinate dehydrogenase iron-sulfur subunit [Chlamydiae bacterium]|nr:succinate dehydrogenase iron-sulfur subunit [Chlamydiota bacterium]
MQFILKIYRGVPGHQYWEEFAFDLAAGDNVISCLMAIQKNPVNKQGKKVAPVVWEQGCLEEVCGSCSMLINGKPKQACSAIIEPLLQQTASRTITLAPFTKYPLIRDLVVDRTALFDSLKKISGWIETDGSFVQGFGPKVTQEEQEEIYPLSTCMSCACCLEACPQINKNSSFIGAAPISQVRLFNTHPTGKADAQARLRILMEEGGISECGNAQNCVQVCPKKIPLTESIAAMGRDVSLQALKDFFGSPER